MTVTVFVGKNGAGKDSAALEFGVLPAWSYGRTVVANCSLFPEEVGYSPDLYMPLNEPLLDLPRLGKHMKRMCVDCRQKAHPEADICRHCNGVLLDVPRMHPDGGLWSITDNKGVGLLLSDITAAFPSRESLGLPPELAQTLQQLRKPDISPVMITCPAWARVDLLLRECVSTVVESYPFNPLWFFPWSHRFRVPPEVPWGWPQNKAFRRFFYDAEEYEKADSTGRWDLCEPKTFGILNRPHRTTWKRSIISEVHRAYDSFEDIELADHIACGECGGRLPRHSCKNPQGHREHARAMRPQRERKAYPVEALHALGVNEITPEIIAALSTTDAEDEREAEQIERRRMRVLHAS